MKAYNRLFKKSVPLGIWILIANFSLVFAQEDGKQVPKKTPANIGTPTGMGYLQYLPLNYSSSTELYPTIIFLHGSGERGTGTPSDLAKVAANGPPKLIRDGFDMCFTVNGKKECFLVLSPQTIAWGWQKQVVPFAKWALQNYRIDPNRLYVTGLSMGGQGTWVTGSDTLNTPNLFAALSPISAKGSYADGKSIALKSIPVWCFHGLKDTAIPVFQDRTPIRGMTENNANPPPIFTQYPDTDHAGTWNRAYRIDHAYHNPNLYEWLLLNKKGIPSKTPPAVNAGVDIPITLPITSTSLTGIVSDIDGTIVTSSIVWKQVSGPATAAMTNPNSLATAITGLTVAGTYVFSLSATDNDNLTTTDQINVKVSPAPPKFPPTANAGGDQKFNLPLNSATLTGLGKDTDGTIKSYQWTQISGPNTATQSGGNTTTLNVSNLIVGAYTFNLTVTDNDNLTAVDQVVVTVLAPIPNAPPVASAGPDKPITLPINSVILNGSGTDSDGTIASYLWVQNSGPSTATTTPASQPQITLSNLIEGVYVFTLTVTDNAGSPNSDQVIITVLPLPPNSPPTALAGNDNKITLPVNSVQLSGSGLDSDGTISSYTWSQDSGPNTAVLNPSATTAAPTATGLIEGVYVFTLTVKDDKNAPGSDQVTITVLPVPPNSPPQALAGGDIELTLPVNSTSLTGNGLDTDGTIASYLWTQINGPSPSTILNADKANALLSNLTAGVYTFEFTVKDDKNASGTDQINVTVFPPANKPPTANAGSNIEITLPVNFTTLSGIGTDADGTIATYGWSQINGPSLSKLITSSQASTEVTDLITGIYTFLLTVTDNTGAPATAQVNVTVLPAPPNQPPVAEAGADQKLVLPQNSIIIHGSGSDLDGVITSYSWSFISGPAEGTVGSLDSADLHISNLVEGTYLFQLTVTDDNGGTDTDEVNVLVNAIPTPHIAPVANAGGDKSISLPITQVSLVGGATDQDGTVVSYQWLQVSGPSAGLINSPKLSSTVISNLTVAGIYVFSLTAIDNDNLPGTNDVQVVVNPEPPNNPPVVTISPDTEITLPINSVLLTGSATDGDGNIIGYKWSQASGPNTASSTDLSLQGITFSNLIAGNYIFRLTATDNKTATGQKDVKVKVNPQPANIPPVSNAGADKEITLPINSVSLNGSGTDIDGTISLYSWTQISGPALATITSNTTPATDVTNLVEGIYVLRLTVTDDKSATAIDEVQIKVNPIPANRPPLATAGNNVIITLPINATSLSGSGLDEDGTIVSQNWSQISGPSPAVTTDLSQKNIDLSNLVNGIYVFRFTVTDDDGSTGFDEINIRVQPVPANQPPTASAGVNQLVTLPNNSTSFNGSGTDPDGTISNYGWIQLAGPSTASLSGTGLQTLTASSLIEGTYIFKITVTDNKGATGFDEVNVRVNQAPPNAPPVANAGANLDITLPVNTIVIHGTGTDSDGTVVSYAWTQSLGPSTASFLNQDSNTLTASDLVEGIYIFNLLVTDNGTLTSSDEVRVIVHPVPPNIPPVVNAGLNKQLILPPNSVTITATASDPDGSIPNGNIIWSQISGKNTAVISNPNSLETSINNLEVDTYVFRITVADNKNASSFDEITVSTKTNLPPISLPGDSILLILPLDSTKLIGGGVDPDGVIQSFQWTQVSGPQETLNTPNQNNITIDHLVTGKYVFGLTVTDDKNATGYNEVIVIVKPSLENLAPAANAGADTTITLPLNSITLNGTGDDIDGVIVSYTWSQLAGPSTSLIADNSKAQIFVSDLIEGNYDFELLVKDNGGLTGKDQVRVSVLPFVNTVTKIPRIFTPNSEGNWKWPDLTAYDQCHLTIFNRVGSKIFDALPYQNNWDGTINGRPLEADAYYYIIQCGGNNITGGVRIVR